MGDGRRGLPGHGYSDQAEKKNEPEHRKDQGVDQRGVVQPKGRSPGGRAPAGVEAADVRRIAVLQPIDQFRVNGTDLRWVENNRYLLGRCVKIKQRSYEHAVRSDGWRFCAWPGL